MVSARAASPRPPRRLALLLLTALLSATLNSFDLANAQEEDGDYEDESDVDDDEDLEEDDDLYWDEEDEYEDEEWESSPNATSDELDILSSVADYMSNVHYLLWDVNINKEQRVSEVVLEESWTPVKRDAVAVAAAAALLPGDTRRALECAVAAEKDARQTLHNLHDTVAQCYHKGKPEFDPPLAEADDDDDDDDQDAEIERDAGEFTKLALALLRASPLVGGSETADLVAELPHGVDALVGHAEMLERRGHRRRARIRRCVDLLMEEAYKHADQARDALATCVLHMGTPPLGVDPRDEL